MNATAVVTLEYEATTMYKGARRRQPQHNLRLGSTHGAEVLQEERTLLL